MDVLQADGSIRWSDAHLAQFTPGRARDEVERAVAARHGLELAIDKAAVTAVDRLLGLLSARGVRIVLIHPPFNPAFYRQVEHAPYGAGLARVAALTRRLAAAHGATVVGSFDPASAGCTEAMSIDAEHSRPICLARVLRQVPGL
jgi:sugar phosphate isomerase/epimerase